MIPISSVPPTSDSSSSHASSSSSSSSSSTSSSSRTREGGEARVVGNSSIRVNIDGREWEVILWDAQGRTRTFTAEQLRFGSDAYKQAVGVIRGLNARAGNAPFAAARFTFENDANGDFETIEYLDELGRSINNFELRAGAEDGRGLHTCLRSLQTTEHRNPSSQDQFSQRSHFYSHDSGLSESSSTASPQTISSSSKSRLSFYAPPMHMSNALTWMAIGNDFPPDLQLSPEARESALNSKLQFEKSVQNDLAEKHSTLEASSLSHMLNFQAQSRNENFYDWAVSEANQFQDMLSYPINDKGQPHKLGQFIKTQMMRLHWKPQINGRGVTVGYHKQFTMPVLKSGHFVYVTIIAKKSTEEGDRDAAPKDLRTSYEIVSVDPKGNRNLVKEQHEASGPTIFDIDENGFKVAIAHFLPSGEASVNPKNIRITQIKPKHHQQADDNVNCGIYVYRYNQLMSDFIEAGGLFQDDDFGTNVTTALEARDEDGFDKTQIESYREHLSSIMFNSRHSSGESNRGSDLQPMTENELSQYTIVTPPSDSRTSLPSHSASQPIEQSSISIVEESGTSSTQNAPILTKETEAFITKALRLPTKAVSDDVTSRPNMSSSIALPIKSPKVATSVSITTPSLTVPPVVTTTESLPQADLSSLSALPVLSAQPTPTRSPSAKSPTEALLPKPSPQPLKSVVTDSEATPAPSRSLPSDADQTRAKVTTNFFATGPIELPASPPPVPPGLSGSPSSSTVSPPPSSKRPISASPVARESTPPRKQGTPAKTVTSTSSFTAQPKHPDAAVNSYLFKRFIKDDDLSPIVFGQPMSNKAITTPSTRRKIEQGMKRLTNAKRKKVKRSPGQKSKIASEKRALKMEGVENPHNDPYINTQSVTRHDLQEYNLNLEKRRKLGDRDEQSSVTLAAAKSNSGVPALKSLIAAAALKKKR